MVATISEITSVQLAQIPAYAAGWNALAVSLVGTTDYASALAALTALCGLDGRPVPPVVQVADPALVPAAVVANNAGAPAPFDVESRFDLIRAAVTDHAWSQFWGPLWRALDATFNSAAHDMETAFRAAEGNLTETAAERDLSGHDVPGAYVGGTPAARLVAMERFLFSVCSLDIGAATSFFTAYGILLASVGPILLFDNLCILVAKPTSFNPATWS